MLPGESTPRGTRLMTLATNRIGMVDSLLMWLRSGGFPDVHGTPIAANERGGGGGDALLAGHRLAQRSASQPSGQHDAGEFLAVNWLP